MSVFLSPAWPFVDCILIMLICTWSRKQILFMSPFSHWAISIMLSCTEHDTCDFHEGKTKTATVESRKDPTIESFVFLWVSCHPRVPLIYISAHSGLFKFFLLMFASWFAWWCQGLKTVLISDSSKVTNEVAFERAPKSNQWISKQQKRSFSFATKWQFICLRNVCTNLIVKRSIKNKRESTPFYFDIKLFRWWMMKRKGNWMQRAS